MEIADRREWKIRELVGDDAVVEQLPEGGERRLRRALLPDGLQAGDRFRVVAQVDRRGATDVMPMRIAPGETIVDLTTV